MDNLNVKNINDEKIFSVIDPQGQGEVQDRIRPISISINQDVKTVSDETESEVTISVYWNDTWKEILNLTFNDSLRKEYGKLVEDLTAIQKDVDMKQYKDAETKTNDMLKYLANISNKYTQMSTKVDNIKSSANPFVTVTAEKDHFSVKVSERLLNFLLSKFEKVATLDYRKSNENFCINASRYNEDTIDLYYHSPALFETQGYMTVVKNFKTIGSYKATYDQFSKLASKLSFTPEKMGYKKDRFVGYTKTAEVVMQNIFFDTVDEAKEWQEMVDEKKKEEVATEETNQEETTEKPTVSDLPNDVQKGNSPAREDGGLARPDEDFADADEMPESEPQQQQQSGQGMAASRRINNVKKKAKKFNIKIDDMDITVNDTTDKFTEEEIKEQIVKKNPTIYWSDDRAEHWFFDFPFEIEGDRYWISSEKIANDLKSMTVRVEEDAFNKDSKNKKALKKKADEITEIEENYKENDFNIKYKKLVIKDNAFVQEELKTETTRVKVEFVVYGYNIPNGMAEAEFNCVVKPSKANAQTPYIEKYTISYDVALDSATKKQLDFILYNLSNKKIQDFCKYNDKGFLVYKYQVAANRKVELNKQAKTVNSKQDIKQILKDKNAVEVRNYGDFVNAIRENKTPVETIKAYGKKKTAGGYDEYVLVVYEGGAYFYTELSANGKRVDEKYYKFENVAKQAENRKNYNVVIGFDGKEEESDFVQEDVISALQEALIYFGEKWHELPSSLDNIDKLDFVKIREIEKGETVKEYTKEDILKMKEDFPKYSCNKKALYGDVQEADIVPAKLETKVYLQSEDNEENMDTVKQETIAIGDIVTVDADTLADNEEYAKYEEFAGQPAILMEVDKGNIDNVVIEKVEYPYERTTIEKEKIDIYDDVAGEEIILEDADGDEMVATISAIPEIAASTKIKSVKKVARLSKKAGYVKIDIEDYLNLLSDRAKEIGRQIPMEEEFFNYIRDFGEDTDFGSPSYVVDNYCINGEFVERETGFTADGDYSNKFKEYNGDWNEFCSNEAVFYNEEEACLNLGL